MLLNDIISNTILKRKRVLLPVGVVSIACMVFFIWAGNLLSSKTIYRGIFVENLNVSGLRVEQAKELLDNHVRALYESSSMVIRYSDKSWNINLEDLGFGFATSNAIKEAYRLGRTGNFFTRLHSIMDLRIKEVNLAAQPVYDKQKLVALLKDIKQQIDQEAASASIAYTSGKIVFGNETIGKRMDVDQNLNIIENELSLRKFNEIEIEVEDIRPEVIMDDIKEINGVMGSTITSFNAHDINRTANIRLACERINGVILKPGEVFSMNKALGPRTIENGYKDAKVIFQNELVDGPGGGVCQVTTTLYGSVLKTRAQIMERMPHSLPLGYVEPGQDATIAEDYIDFKFKNNLEYPLALNAEVVGNNLYTRVLGRKDDESYSVKLRSVVVEEYMPEEEEIIIDNSITDNERHVVREARKGLRAVVYRELYNKDGQLVEKEKVSDDVYKPVKAQVKVGRYYNYNNVHSGFYLE